MSRRRPSLPDLPDGQAWQYTTAVVCTDEGQHACVSLNHVRDTRGEPPGAGERVMWLEGPRGQAPLTSWNPEIGDQGFRFTCPRCGRDTELQQETLFKLFDGLTAQPGTGRAHPVVDISLLPF